MQVPARANRYVNVYSLSSEKLNSPIYVPVNSPNLYLQRLHSKSLIFKMIQQSVSTSWTLSPSLPSSMTKVHGHFLSRFQRVLLDCIHARSTNVPVKIILYFLFQMFGYYTLYYSGIYRFCYPHNHKLHVYRIVHVTRNAGQAYHYRFFKELRHI